MAGMGHLVCTAPGLARLCEVQHVLLPIHQEVVTSDAELSTLVVVVPMPCSRHDTDSYISCSCMLLAIYMSP